MGEAGPYAAVVSVTDDDGVAGSASNASVTVSGSTETTLDVGITGVDAWATGANAVLCATGTDTVDAGDGDTVTALCHVAHRV